MAGRDDDKTRPNIPGPGPGSASADSDRTRPVNASGVYYDDGEDDEPDDSTRPVLPGGGSAGTSTASSGGASRITVSGAQGNNGPSITYPRDTASQPVCGFLLIVKGPGLGIGVPLSYGRTAVGRDPGARLQLRLGDSQLSGLHFIISYEESDGSFDVKEADAASNATYLNGARLRAPAMLSAGDVIRAGGTEFRFVPCCGPDWNWSKILTAAG